MFWLAAELIFFCAITNFDVVFLCLLCIKKSRTHSMWNVCICSGGSGNAMYFSDVCIFKLCERSDIPLHNTVVPLRWCVLCSLYALSPSSSLLPLSPCLCAVVRCEKSHSFCVHMSVSICFFQNPAIACVCIEICNVDVLVRNLQTTRTRLQVLCLLA